jgi:transitional endoplasmic reticulum ATPase
MILRVQEAFPQDLGLGRARINNATKKELELEIGDIIAIEGKRTTAARVFRTQLEDEGKDIIRLDSITRNNISVSIDERVTISKAEAKPADDIILTPVLKSGHKIKFEEGLSNFVLRVLNKHPIVEDNIIVVPGITLMGGYLPFKVIKTKPSGIVYITDKTNIQINQELLKEPIPKEQQERVLYEDIGGLKEELKRIREMVELPLRHPELFDRLGIKSPKGVLLYGPPGTGKTMIAKAVAYESNAHFVSIQGPEIMSQYYGQSEAKIREIFEEAEKNVPSIIFIDEIDSIAPKRDETHGEVERRVVAQLLTLMDGLKSRGNVIVIGATNREDSIDPALRRPGRFDREIEIGVPSKADRLDILKVHTRFMPIGLSNSGNNNIEDVDKEKNRILEKLSEMTVGFVGADLAALCREAAMKTLRRYLPSIDLEKPIPQALLNTMVVTEEDFYDALKEIEPSSLREVSIDIPNVKWEDIGGLEEAKRDIKESIEMPIKNPEIFKKLGIEPVKGILLYGPPGTGKTMIAKAIATESGANFVSIKGPEILSKWMGDSEKAIRQLFKKAKQASPSIIFIDEIDSIAAKRRGDNNEGRAMDSIVNQILTSMDGIENMENVFVLAATNRPDIIDESLLRNGRFDKLIYIPPPDKKSRMEILRLHTAKMHLDNDVSLESLADQTENYVGADIKSVCRDAAIVAFRNGAQKVSMDHFRRAIASVHPTMSDRLKDFYEQFRKNINTTPSRKQEPHYYS